MHGNTKIIRKPYNFTEWEHKYIIRTKKYTASEYKYN